MKYEYEGKIFCNKTLEVEHYGGTLFALYLGLLIQHKANCIIAYHIGRRIDKDTVIYKSVEEFLEKEYKKLGIKKIK